jgi:hypothetical protein
MSIRTRSRSRVRCAALACAVGLSLPTPARARADEPGAGGDSRIERRREIFKSGMDDYANGRFREAIGKWEPIYRELGAEQGYRLAFNLARAYDKVDDATRAAEYYETYVAEVKRRRDRELDVEPAVEKQAEDAALRLEELKKTHGRIAIGPGQRVVRIGNGEQRVAGARGFVEYVAPGRHVVKFDPGTPEEREMGIDVEAGALVPVETPRVAPPVAAPPPLRYETRVERPFSPVFLWVAGGLTVASLALPVVLRENALSVKSDYDRTPESNTAERQRLAADYDEAKTNAYVSYAVPAVFALATGALVTWYFVKTTEQRVPVTVQPEARIGPEGGSVGLRARF